MSNIEENAFQIARHLLEDPHEDGQVAIRDSLGLSDEDFRFALKFLVDGNYCKTYGQFGGKSAGIRQKNLVELQDFVNRINENRVPLSLDAERLLKFLFDSPTPASDSEQTMSFLGWEEKRYRTALESLKFKEYIDIQYADNKPFDVWITNNGREIVRSNFRLPFQEAIRIETNNDVASSKAQTMPMTNRPLRVFLCHSSNDKPTVRELYKKLHAQTWIQPWLDEEELYPGQDWNLEIEKAIEATDIIIVCLTKSSVTKEGYIQREIRIALDYADYKPEGTLYIIPVRLEECEPPRRLRAWQYADYFEGQREWAFERLLISLKRRADSLDLKVEEPTSKIEGNLVEKKKPVIEIPQSTLSEHPTRQWIIENKITLSNSMEFMRVPAGKFIMGSKREDEKPQHTLEIPYDYWMARFPITNELYNDYVVANDIVHPASMRRRIIVWKGESETEVINWDNIKNHPLYIDLDNAIMYCQWLNDFFKEELPFGFVLRLPTEAEWEKAARGIDGRLYPWGDKFDLHRCNTQESGLRSTSPVDAYSPQGDSPYGIADMSGNVWEWTRSLFKKYPYDRNDGRENLKTPGKRVMRGSSFQDIAKHSHVTSRVIVPADDGTKYGGIRVCLAPPILQ